MNTSSTNGWFKSNECRWFVFVVEQQLVHGEIFATLVENRISDCSKVIRGRNW